MTEIGVPWISLVLSIIAILYARSKPNLKLMLDDGDPFGITSSRVVTPDGINRECIAIPLMLLNPAKISNMVSGWKVVVNNKAWVISKRGHSPPGSITFNDSDDVLLSGTLVRSHLLIYSPYETDVLAGDSAIKIFVCDCYQNEYKLNLRGKWANKFGCNSLFI